MNPSYIGYKSNRCKLTHQIEILICYAIVSLMLMAGLIVCGLGWQDEHPRENLQPIDRDISY